MQQPKTLLNLAEIKLSLQNSLLRQSPSELNNVLDSIKEPLSQGLVLYKLAVNQSQEFSKVLSLQKKWEFAEDVKGIDISSEMRNRIFIPLIEELQIDCDSVISLCNICFMLNGNQFRLLCQLESQLQSSQARVGTMQQRRIEEERYNQYLIEFRNVVGLIMKNIKINYFNQRRLLLNVLNIIVQSSTGEKEVNQICKNFVSNALSSRNLYANLIQSLIRNLDWKEQLKNCLSRDNLTKNLIIDSIQLEQIETLKILLQLSADKTFNTVSSSEKDQYLEYLVMTAFDGNILVQTNKGYGNEQTDDQLERKDIIKTLGQMCWLSLIGLHLSPQPQIQLHHKFEAVNLTQSSTFIYLPIIIARRQQQQFQDKIKSLPILIEVQQILQSSFMLKSNLEDIKSIIMTLLFKWLDQFYLYESSRQNPNQDTIEEILQFGEYILRDKENIKKFWAEGPDSLQMFKSYFQSPKNNLPQVIRLLDILCGQSRCKQANQVLDFLENKDLLNDFFTWITVKIQKLNDQQAQTEEEIQTLCCACVVLAKILKQQDQLFELNRIFDKLNEYYIRTSSNYQPSRPSFQPLNDRSPFRGLMNNSQRDSFLQPVKFESGEFPLISLVIKILNIFALVQPSTGGERCLHNMVNALEQLYIIKSGYVMQELTQHRNTLATQSNFQLVEILAQRIQQPNQNDCFNEKLTCSVLSLINGMVKVDFPQQNLNQDDRTKFEYSFIAQSLISIYKPIVVKFLDLQFQSLKSVTSTAFHVLKLTKSLLFKFSQVKDNGQKLLLSLPFPQFDMLYQVFFSVVDSEAINQICFNILQLSETNTSSNQLYENRFIDDYNRNQGASMVKGAIRSLQRVIKVSLQVLNLLLELGLSYNNSAEVVSRQSNYIRKLIPVNILMKHIKNNISQGTVQGKLIGIASIMVYYVCPSHQLKYEYITSLALKFLTLSMQITQTDLYKTFQENYSLNLKFLFMDYFRSQLVESTLQVEFLDFWIQAIEKQPRLFEGLWQQFDPKYLINFVEKLENISDRKIIKLCVLTQLMAEKKCCVNILEHNSHQLVTSMFSKIIEPLLATYQKPFPFDGNQLFQLLRQLEIESKDLEQVQLQISQFNTKITLVYFLSLVQIEFSRVPVSTQLRKIIKELGSSQQLNKIGTFQKNYMVQTIFQVIDANNSIVLKQKEGYDLRQQQFNHQYYRNQSLFPIDLSNNHPLRAQDACIFVTGVDCAQLFAALSNTPSYMLINSSENLKHTNGLVGINFAVDINELQYAYLAECYYPKFRQQTICSFQEFNMFLSEVYTETLVLKAKYNFFLSIGQSMMSQAQNKVSTDLLITTSMLPIVTQHEIYQRSADQIMNEIQQLIQAAQQSVGFKVQTIQQMKQVTNKICVEYFDQTIQSLIVHLGVLSHLSKYIQYQQQDPFSVKSLLASLMVQVSEFNLSNNVETQKQFAQVTLLVLQILEQIQVTAEETPTLRVLSLILDCMKAGNILSDGLKIFTIACSVLKPEKFNIFMYKQDSLVLRTILYRLNDQNITASETQEIITFLQTYARNPDGSQHLQKLKVLEKLRIGDYLRNLNEQAPYVISNNAQVRNQVNIQWLQIILLIRQLNANLIRTPKTENIGYFKQCCQFVALVQQRFRNILNVGMNSLSGNRQNDSSAVMSVAIFEEIELICSLYVQLFEHADLWAELDFSTYSNVKDQMLFNVPQLLSKQIQNALLPSSMTEQHLANIKSEDRNGLKMKIEISQIKIILSCASSMHNVFSLQDESQVELFKTWGYKKTNYIDNLMQQDYAESQETPVQCAFENYKKCLENLHALLIQYQSERSPIDNLLKQVSDFFMNNEWTQKEYSGGLGAMLIEEEVNELITIIEVTLGIGMYVLTQLLDCVRNQINQGGMNQFQSLERSYNSRLQQSEYFEERIVVNFAIQVRKLIHAVYGTINWDNKEEKIWGDNPNDYMSALFDFAQMVEENPTSPLQFQY